MPISLIGEMMTPRSKFCEVSGLRFAFPPFNPSPCELQAVALNGPLYELPVPPALVGQSGFPCPMVPPVDAVKKFGVYSWKSVGARKPVEAAPLKVRNSAGGY